ncbi:hypothetical protein GCM10010172_07590 [Paractinoplanes ferrugineus]|uniref:DUF4097 domain-containing protein n=1 Tax=Paractinoplanes ferrugineus TaxID=113564 RepID=A0A919MQZ9_9ACTN|nr:DUF4097 family beta strand repeat-containing protein [Actinoplanes ferrugineus]GIE16862.1 hypothetical protein Afe05nite_87020 [Actinoplanes ferrugineus]
MTTVEHTGRQRGPVTLHIKTQAADIQVVSDPNVNGSWIELSTPDQSGPAVDAIRRAEFRDHGNEIHVDLREGQNVSGGGVTIGGNNYGIIAGNVNGYSSQVIINGRVVSSSGPFSAGPITVRAILEPGSTLVAKTMSGDVTTKGVHFVQAQTMSGDIRADEVTGDSQLKSMSGDIRVQGSPAAHVTASTMSGDVSGSGVVLSGSSMSGRVLQR